MIAAIVFRVLGWFGGDLFATIQEKVADYIRRKANDDLARLQTTVGADTQIAISHVNAELEARKVQAQVLRADRGWWVTAWIRPLIVYPCVVHFGAIVLDSTFLFGWSVAKLPAPYDFYEQAIILSFFIARPFEKAARVFTASRR